MCSFFYCFTEETKKKKESAKRERSVSRETIRIEIVSRKKGCDRKKQRERRDLLRERGVFHVKQ